MARGPSLGNYIRANFLPARACACGKRHCGARPHFAGSYSFIITVTDSAMPSAQTNLFYFTINIYPARGSHRRCPLPKTETSVLGRSARIRYNCSLREATAPIHGKLPEALCRQEWHCELTRLLTSRRPPRRVFSALATTPGTYSFTLSVSSAGQTASQLYSMKISTLLVKDLYQVPDAFVGVPYPVYTLSAIRVGNAAAGPVTWTLTGPMPPGMTFTNGVIAGTPTTSGFYSINFNVTDRIDTIFRNLNISVSAVRVTSPGVLPNGTLGAPYSYTLTAAGGTGSFTWSTNSLPNGLSLNSSTGVISGSINSSPGPSIFNATATDGNHVCLHEGDGNRRNRTPPASPALFPYSPYSDCSVGVPCERAIRVFAGGTAPYTWIVSNLPPGMDFRFGSNGNNGNMQTYVAPTDVELWGTPTAIGTYNYTVIVIDSTGLSATETFPMHVSALTLDPYPPNGTIGAPYSFTLRVLGGNGTYTAQVVAGAGSALPAGVSLTGLTLSGTPAENGSFNPTILFSDTASPTPDNLQLNFGMFINGPAGATIQVSNPNFPSFGVNSQLSFQFGACCATSYIWSVASGTVPPGMTLSAQGLLSGTFTTAGTFSFLVQAADSSNAANFGRRLITVTVSPPSFAGPNSLPAGLVGTAYSPQTLTATGGTGALTWSTVLPYLLPPGLTLNATTGQISGHRRQPGSISSSLQSTIRRGTRRRGITRLTLPSRRSRLRVRCF